MKIFNIKLNKLDYYNFLNTLKTKLKKSNSSFIKNNKRRQKIIFTPNPEILLNTLKDKEFNKILKKADFLTIDGIGIYIGLQILENKKNIFFEILLLPYYFFNLFFKRKYLYKKYGERICGSDLTSDLVNFSEKENIKITILDPYYPKDLTKVESQKNFRKNLTKKFPKLNFDFFIYNPEKKEIIIEKIGKSHSKILFSTLGMKTQEKSIIEILEKCPNIKLGLGIGSSFDYFTGFQKRAPKIFRIIGIEWLYRIITGPQKLKRIKRLYNAIFVFIFKILFYKK